MKFITADEFNKQPKDIQNIFLDWWSCELYDIYAFSFDEENDKWCIAVCTAQKQADSINESKETNPIIPLLAEGQLRTFIESKTNGIVKNTQWNIEDSDITKRGYSIYLLKKDEYHVTHHFTDLGDDLLLAYWKVACMIAKEYTSQQHCTSKKNN